jgi:hypothetical protein
MAYACRKKGIPLTVYASTRASPLKLERMQAMGAGRKSHAYFLVLPERVFRKITLFILPFLHASYLQNCGRARNIYFNFAGVLLHGRIVAKADVTTAIGHL